MMIDSNGTTDLSLSMQPRSELPQPRGGGASGSASTAGVAVDIYDQIYHLRGVDSAYIEHLAQIVDARMRAVSAHGGTVDSLRVAVLAALNIADELEFLRQRYDLLAKSTSQSQQRLRSRAGSLAHLLDEVITDSEVRKVG